MKIREITANSIQELQKKINNVFCDEGYSRVLWETYQKKYIYDGEVSYEIEYSVLLMIDEIFIEKEEKISEDIIKFNALTEDEAREIVRKGLEAIEYLNEQIANHKSRKE